MHAGELELFVGLVLAFLLTVVWIAVHVVGAIRLGSGLNDISRRAGIAWIIAGAGGFTGPLVIPASMVSMGLALVEYRSDDLSPPTRQALRTVIAADAIILVMAGVLVVAVLASLGLSAAG